MTAEAILARKRELLDAYRAETDEFNRFFLREELADLNARLRSLRRAPRARRRTGGARGIDRAQYQSWLAGEDDAAETPERRACAAIARESAAVLTARQREVFDAWCAGTRVSALAERFGVERSTVSRTLCRGKARLRAAAETRAKALRLGGGTLDLADGETARLVLSCLTARQAVCLYLYYGEWLSLRDCGELLGVDHTAVLRTVRRGLRAVGDMLHGGAFTLDNADALGDLAYALYLEAGSPDALPPEPPRAAWARQTLRRRRAARRERAPTDCAVRTSDGLIGARGVPHRAAERPPGKLLALLYTLRARGPVYRWLARLFRRIVRPLARGAKNPPR